MEILTSVKRLYISFKSLVNDFVYSFGRAALLLLVEVYNHTVPVRERGRIRVKPFCKCNAETMLELVKQSMCAPVLPLCARSLLFDLIKLIADTAYHIS